MGYRVFLYAGGAVFAFCPVAALAQNGLEVAASSGVTVSRNPFLQMGDGTAAAAAFIQVSPSYRISDEVSTVKIVGSVRIDEYTRRYDTSSSMNLELDVARLLSPDTTLRARASARSSRTSALDFLVDPGVEPPATPPPTSLPDVTFAGAQQRSTMLEAGVGIDKALNERERLSVDLATSTNLFSRAGSSDYRFATLISGYNRQLSEKTFGFVSLRVGASDYFGRQADDGLIVTPTAGISTALGAQLSLDVSAGASFSRVNLGGGRHSSRLIPSLRAKFCQRSATGANCLNASRETQPTALSGLSTVTNLAASFSRQLSLRDDVSATASLVLTGRPAGSARNASAADLFLASATYSHKFDRRLSVTISPSYTDLFDAGSRRRGNPAVRIGLNYRFGGIG